MFATRCVYVLQLVYSLFQKSCVKIHGTAIRDAVSSGDVPTLDVTSYVGIVRYSTDCNNEALCCPSPLFHRLCDPDLPVSFSFLVNLILRSRHSGLLSPAYGETSGVLSHLIVVCSGLFIMSQIPRIPCRKYPYSAPSLPTEY